MTFIQILFACGDWVKVSGMNIRIPYLIDNMVMCKKLRPSVEIAQTGAKKT
jgi:hypothetical protein